MAEKQTAGRTRLGDLAPKFAELNDDVLFGEVWSREEQLSPRDRSLITIAALFSAGLYPQLKSHLELGRAHGVTRQEAVELVTQLAFYCGWRVEYLPADPGGLRRGRRRGPEPAVLLPPRGEKRRLRAVFYRAELPRAAVHPAGAGVQRDV